MVTLPLLGFPQPFNRRISVFSPRRLANNAVYLPLLNRQIDVINGRERHLAVVKDLRNIAENNHSYSLSVRPGGLEVWMSKR